MLASRVAGVLDGAVRARPFTFGVLAGMANGTIADLSAQRLGGADFDRTRLAVFTTFGCVYSGMAQYVIYAVAYPRMASALELAKWGPNAIKLCTLTLDQAVQVPFLYFPVFYATGACVSAAHGVRALKVRCSSCVPLATK